MPLKFGISNSLGVYTGSATARSHGNHLAFGGTTSLPQLPSLHCNYYRDIEEFQFPHTLTNTHLMWDGSHPLLIRPRCPDTSPNSSLWMQSTPRGSFSVHRSEKTPGSKYSSTSGLSPRGHLERQAEFHASTQDEAWLRINKWNYSKYHPVKGDGTKWREHQWTLRQYWVEWHLQLKEMKWYTKSMKYKRKC